MYMCRYVCVYIYIYICMRLPEFGLDPHGFVFPPTGLIADRSADAAEKPGGFVDVEVLQCTA